MAWELGNGAHALLPAFPVGLQCFSEAQRGGYLPCRNLRGMSFIYFSKSVDYKASRVNSGEFSSGPEVKTLHFHCRGVQVRALVEVRFHLPWCIQKRKKERKKEMSPDINCGLWVTVMC